MTRNAWQFFVANAGCVVGERAVGAARLARAEELVAGDESYRYRWEADPDADFSWMDEAEAAREHTAEGCVLEHRCVSCGAWKPVASLWGIFDADDSYRRIVEAELACERAE